MADAPRKFGSKAASAGRSFDRAAFASGSGRGVDGKESAARRGYGARWKKASATFLERHPLCMIGAVEGRAVASEVTDHLYPHCRLSWLFWDSRLWLAMAKPWHDGPKQRTERAGEAAIDALAMRLGRPTLVELVGVERAAQWRARYALRLAGEAVGDWV